MNIFTDYEYINLSFFLANTRQWFKSRVPTISYFYILNHYLFIYLFINLFLNQIVFSLYAKSDPFPPLTHSLGTSLRRMLSIYGTDLLIFRTGVARVGSEGARVARGAARAGSVEARVVREEARVASAAARAWARRPPSRGNPWYEEVLRSKEELNSV